jgi:magnesium chelatase family protein
LLRLPVETILYPSVPSVYAPRWSQDSQDNLQALVLALSAPVGKKATQLCPCGYFNHPSKDCVCGPGIVQKYLNKISGPLLDRIDLHVEVTPVPFEKITDESKSEESGDIRERVIKARMIQAERYVHDEMVHCNAQMERTHLEQYAVINEAGKLLLSKAMQRLNLSARAYDRIIKVSRTIADLSGSEEVKLEHLAEAIHFRSLDRENWAG